MSKIFTSIALPLVFITSIAKAETVGFAQVSQWTITADTQYKFCAMGNLDSPNRLVINVGQFVTMAIFLPVDQSQGSQYVKDNHYAISLKFSNGDIYNVTVKSVTKELFSISTGDPKIISSAISSETLFIPEFNGFYLLNDFNSAWQATNKCFKLIN